MKYLYLKGISNVIGKRLSGRGRNLGVEIPVIKSVAEVESAGNVFPDGGSKILFVSHIFSKLTGHIHDNTYPSISRLKWN